MDEETAIINTNTRNQKIKDFLLKNKKNLITISVIIVVLLVSYFSYNEIKKYNKSKLAEKYNQIILSYDSSNKEKIINKLAYIIDEKDTTYSPLALYFLLDNNLIENRDEINKLFNTLIEETNLKKEIKNLIIYKKALYNSNYLDENELMTILKPIINSESIWKSHSLYLMAEYFYSKGEKQKSKEFFNQIVALTNSNNDIKLESIKRLNKDLSE
tara:strand:- start:37 stop:681 length:645 start_codon:yes stop_codon:yes gene_type:complete